MDFLPENIQQYAEAHTSPESALLQKVNRDTHAYMLAPRMLSGHLQGRLLSMLAKMIRPTNILEIGTYTGYATLCMAEALQENGKIYTIDVNEELEDRVKLSFDSSPWKDQIEFIIGDAKAVIPTIQATFDLVFIDADKKSYSDYFDLVIEKVSKGGIILADNVLWSGKVVAAEETQKMDKDTQALVDFNEKVHQDSRVENVLLPVRDGIMMLRKI